MTTILFVTVGGSPQPILTSIETLKPDRVIFVCSKTSKSQVIGTGTPCEIRKGSEIVDRLPNIPTQTNLGNKFQESTDLVELVNPDNLAECYQKIVTKIQELQRISPLPTIKADYTGGTKTMTASLVIASIDHRVELLLTTGERLDLIRVEQDEMTAQAQVAPVLIQQTIEHSLPVFLQQYNFPGAITQLTELPSIKNSAISSSQKRTIQVLKDICQGFEAWDRFDHIAAMKYLKNYQQYSEIESRVGFLRKVIDSRKKIDDNIQVKLSDECHGYEIVQDLLLNADRRATQDRYDDAVGRLYRALELLAQVRLWQKYQIRTGNLDISKLPENIRGDYNNHDELGLFQSYQLLAQIKSEPMGKLYQQHKQDIKKVLKKRNNSLFAHGFSPITVDDYAGMHQAIEDFIHQCIEVVASNRSTLLPTQFPIDLSFIGKESIC
jgi:CRISPR-associated protein (TIGR02710 family)